MTGQAGTGGGRGGRQTEIELVNAAPLKIPHPQNSYDCALPVSTLYVCMRRQSHRPGGGSLASVTGICPLPPPLTVPHHIPFLTFVDLYGILPAPLPAPLPAQRKSFGALPDLPLDLQQPAAAAASLTVMTAASRWQRVSKLAAGPGREAFARPRSSLTSRKGSFWSV